MPGGWGVWGAEGDVDREEAAIYKMGGPLGLGGSMENFGKQASEYRTIGDPNQSTRQAEGQ